MQRRAESQARMTLFMFPDGRAPRAGQWLPDLGSQKKIPESRGVSSSLRTGHSGGCSSPDEES